MDNKPVLLIAGLSGAGRSSVLNALEDIGYSTIDNMPLAFARHFFENMKNKEIGAPHRPMAMTLSGGGAGMQEVQSVLDFWDFIKHKQTSESMLKVSSQVQSTAQFLPKKLVFLESEKGVILRRYRETRRRHPLAVPGRTLEESVDLEREMWNAVKKKADHVLDTSSYTPLELRTTIRHLFNVKAKRQFWVDVVSFAFGRGIPADAHMVFDMRFLKNPHYHDALRPLTGEHEDIQHYLEGFPAFQHFYQHLRGLLKNILPPVRDEGRGLFVLAFGCTGGRHRSVATAEFFYHWLRQEGFEAERRHRELLVHR